MTIDFEAAADEQAAVPASDAQLRTISDLAQQVLNLEQQVLADEARATATKASLKKVQCELLPAAMRDARVLKLTLENGAVLSVDNEVYASITEARQADAFAWLTATGNAAIIKHVFTVTVPREDQAAAKKLQALLADNGFGEYDVKSGVHAGTLKAFVKAELAKEAGTTLPKDTFSVFEQTVAKIKLPKARRK
jgi:hypothetical protein